MIFVDSAYYENKEYGAGFYNFNRDVPWPYSLGLFPLHLEFDDITFLYGENASGKTTLLDLLSDKLKSKREFSGDFFADTYYCGPEVTVNPHDDCVSEMRIDKVFETFACSTIKSNDVFGRISERAEKNRIAEKDIRDVRDKKRELKYKKTPRRICSEDDWDRFMFIYDSHKMTYRKFCDTYAKRKQAMQSNGETALSYFAEKFSKGGLFLLDEPENCLSISFQLELLEMIEGKASEDCQFIIASHSPVLLSCHGATIYNLESDSVRKMHFAELRNMQILYRLFKAYGDYFEKEIDK